MKFSQLEWVKILESDMWHLLEKYSNINPTLRLIYHNLPSNLKRCFAFCSIFPHGYEFDKDRLIKIWMAEGLLKCCRTDKSEEELGNEFFKDLESISFFQQGEYNDFVMHDLVSDLAKSVSGELCLRIEGDRVQDIPERTRHIWWSVELEDGSEILERIYKIKGLPSLMLKPKGYVPEFQCFKMCNNVQHDLFSRLKYMRMLSFCGCNLSELFVGISNLKLLRYLDLTEIGIQRLPDSICILHNLQTLILECCPLAELPLDFYKLINLHHLNLNGTRIIKMPKQIGRLVHLQVLPRFVVGEHSGSDIKELAELNHLQGTLWIEGLKNVIYPADAVEANLKDKKYLEELRMLYGYSSEINGSMIEMHVLEALQPNSNLIRLTIQDYRGTSFPKWLGYHHLPNLVSLKLSDCKFCSYLPPLGQLPSLKMLSIRSCEGIQFIGPEFYGNNSSNVPFRSLEILEFEYMPDLKEWLCFEGFPSLKKLHISCCPKFKRALPRHLHSLQILDISNCEELEASIPKVDNISVLRLESCENILLKELPSSLESASLHGTRVIKSSSEQILFNNAWLEDLFVSDFNGANKHYSMDLRSCKCNSLLSLSITNWHSSSLPFALDLFTNLHYLSIFVQLSIVGIVSWDRFAFQPKEP